MKRLSKTLSAPLGFWVVWAVAIVAVLLGYVVDWLNTGAFAGAYAVLVALAGTTYSRRPGVR